jgi:hypothetical protein
VRGDAVAESFDGADGFVGAIDGDEVLGLDLLAAGGGEVEFEVGETFVPGSGLVELVGAGLGGVRGDGVQFFGGEGRLVEGGCEGWGWCGGVEAVLEPDGACAGVLPIGKERDAVGGGDDLQEVVLERGEGKVLVDDLRDAVGGFEGEGEAGDDAEGSEGDDGGGEGVWIAGAREGVERAVGGDELDGEDGSGEVAVMEAGAVRCGGDGSADRDVGE